MCRIYGAFGAAKTSRPGHARYESDGLQQNNMTRRFQVASPPPENEPVMPEFQAHSPNGIK
ncbi:hypothetical protein F441_06092 [Phytophthora nicotianae CJ01A1]|uniref:Uncharacterized protein n=6 Tax=Phytophthora nicotianae TaxID=4792 RepID=W2RCG1_PHYN3|nr:hypothetical protein PPTG_20899 [Phytophthora nicotianae INRA-310]ETI50359.1 hypothetical protein F443_06084 [Phytophthora nicotianae P1569]ETK90235.1 hypothetical protein L915_05960 [Phytophthora nicotianae]ETO79090.1 hypothetical protein F444_06141 [Phytophthora nicotianae P1976]ETP20130.1 hypothetical protein F441_06092 [Phytophthora nicotianae CJ01A1]ETP48070.1 hypothetical protein F442_06121 [Phytophthora nicotianae P10297]